VARGVEGLHRPAALVVACKVVVDRVLDHRQAARRGQLRQAAAPGQRHRRAQRVRQRGHDHHRLDRLRVERRLQCVHRQPVARVGRDLEGLELQLLEDLKEAEVGRRLQRHHVARLRDRAQAQGDRLQAAIGQQQALRVERAPQSQRVSCHRAASVDVARRLGVARQCLPLLQRGLGDGAPQAVGVEQLGRRAGGAERDHARILGQAQYLGGEGRPVDHLCRQRWTGGLRLGTGRRPRRHEVARARPRLDQTGILECTVGLGGGGQRDVAFARNAPHRGHALASPQRPAADRGCQAVGDLGAERVWRGHAAFSWAAARGTSTD
jgi:hypothetical protein